MTVNLESQIGEDGQLLKSIDKAPHLSTAPTCFFNNTARLVSHPARFGCSAPNAFSPIAIALTNNGSALS